MTINILIYGIFPTEMAEIQKDIGINFYKNDADLPEKDINVQFVNSPVDKLTTEDMKRILKRSGQGKGFWANFNFSNKNDFENIYNVKIQDPTLGMYYESYRYNFWDQMFSAALRYKSYPTFPFALKEGKKPLRVETVDGKKLDVESIMIPKTLTTTHTYVTDESPFNLPAGFEVVIDYPDKIGKELFHTEPYGANVFYGKSVLKRKIEILTRPELTVDKIRDFEIWNVDTKTLTDHSLQKIFSVLPSFAYETVGIMNSWFDDLKLGRVVSTMPTGPVLGTVGSIPDVCEEHNVEYTTQACLTLGRRTGGYIEHKGKKLREVMQLSKEMKIGEQLQVKKKEWPFDVYSEINNSEIP